MVCSSSSPGELNGLYYLPYVEAVEGYRHGYMTKHDGVRWTRDASHPIDPKCPECAA